MTIEIRIATPEDGAAVCSILRRTIAQCCVEDHRNDDSVLAAWLGNKTPENVAGWLQCPAYHSLVAVRDARLIGVAILTRAGRIVLFYVAPEARLQGAGKVLLAAVEEQARRWGLHSVCVSSTLTAQSFYARQGYVAGEPRKAPYGVDAIGYTKQLVADGAPRSGCRCGAKAG